MYLVASTAKPSSIDSNSSEKKVSHGKSRQGSGIARSMEQQMENLPESEIMGMRILLRRYRKLVGLD
jgi:hypothetical protein